MLGQNSYWIVNKAIVKEVGHEAAVLLSDLVDKYCYNQDKNQLIQKDGDLWFYATVDTIEESTYLSEKIQYKCINLLVKHGLIKKVVTGLPAKRHFALCENKILHLLGYSSDLSAELDQTKGRTIKNKYIKNKDKEENKEIYKENFQSQFEEEKKIEVIKPNPKTKPKTIDRHLDKIEEILSHLNSEKNPEKKAARGFTATKNTKMLLNAILDESHNSIGLIKEIITYKAKQWLNSDYEAFLRPQTLFGGKFDSYANETELWIKKGRPEKTKKEEGRTIMDRFSDEQFKYE